MSQSISPPARSRRTSPPLWKPFWPHDRTCFVCVPPRQRSVSSARSWGLNYTLSGVSLFLGPPNNTWYVTRILPEAPYAPRWACSSLWRSL
ncbi:Piso0_001955 [Millerozyma farinosa CBS 7064]|uniref:Piso0_001955 protein n=1 Tax=Pichia sorbitophila (strain ATCC MYA-4447 / BCRC 22081 / CBS 7064 / NBRC 10061 / NRRL Y-12695) TaxID=559304 RepID=G8YBB0_PICSO|nr:Piso0_001955 [Millerozyma farinosa CBS 7064]